jgi:hypothetical protein
MSDQDEIELTEAFNELTAPRSTANYAQRTSAVEVRGTGSHWPQALASVLAVVVALAGAGTFLALRNARQNNLATAAGGNPPARSGAAMAYDSAAGVTVMYGGSAATGSALHDTWLWNGTTWALVAQSGGPGPMVDVHMSGDPHDGGVLLIGMPELPIASGSGSGSGSSTISGCVIGATGSGSANAGTAVAGPPSSATGAPGATTIVPSAVATPSSVPLATPAIPRASPCPVVVTPAVQTWIFDSQGWHRVDAAAGALMPAANAQVAYDPASGDVLAVATMYYPCGAPLGAGATKQPQIACESPLASGVPSSSGTGSTGTSGSSAAPQVCTVTQCPIRTVPCPLSSAIYSCGGGGSVSTWIWSGGHWSARPNAGPTAVGASVVPVSAAGAGHASLLEVQPLGLAGLAVHCAVAASCVSESVTYRWTWEGSGWGSETKSDTAPAPDLSAASLAATGSGTLAVAADGAWTVSGVGWTRELGSSPAGRSGEAMAEGPGDTVVLFGGTAVVSGAVAGYSRASVGSDTWSWHSGTGWQHLTGSVPPPPTPCPTAAKTGPGCVEILPAQVPPATSAVPGSASTSPAAASATP